MPLYEYQCTKCGHRVEVIQRFDDPPLAVCENCGGEMKKLLSAPAFHLKGSGWYATDYAGKKSGGADGGESKKSGGAASKDDSSSSSAESSSDTKSDAKPAAPSSGGDSSPAPAAPAKKDGGD